MNMIRIGELADDLTTTSMLMDHRAGRASEIDAINGMAVELGAKLHIATPCNEILTAVVRRWELAFQ